jgi:hypothetical protein
MLNLRLIRNGEDGFMLPYSAHDTEYAEVIARSYRDDQRYAELVRSSRAAFDERLNWDAWGMTVSDLIAQLLGRESQKTWIANLAWKCQTEGVK